MSGLGARALKTIGAGFAQFVVALVVIFVVSIVVPYAVSSETGAGLFVLTAGFGFALGVVLGGLLVWRWRWLPGKPMYTARIVLAVVGVYAVLALGLLLDLQLEGPVATSSIIVGILGFHIPGWISKA